MQLKYRINYSLTNSFFRTYLINYFSIPCLYEYENEINIDDCTIYFELIMTNVKLETIKFVTDFNFEDSEFWLKQKSKGDYKKFYE